METSCTYCTVHKYTSRLVQEKYPTPWFAIKPLSLSCVQHGAQMLQLQIICFLLHITAPIQLDGFPAAPCLEVSRKSSCKLLLLFQYLTTHIRSWLPLCCQQKEIHTSLRIKLLLQYSTIQYSVQYVRSSERRTIPIPSISLCILMLSCAEYMLL